MSILFKKSRLSRSQKHALELLEESRSNIFLTGVAGSGKSFLLRRFFEGKDPKTFPVLASTGMAAILIGGRTFHSFFGLGILEGGPKATVERALKNKRLIARLEKIEGFVLDEVSMISAPTLSTAEEIARKGRRNPEPWGGLRVIAVGDFAQLPPVNPFRDSTGLGREWAFLSEAWALSAFEPAILQEVMRSKDEVFVRVLNEIRRGRISPEVSDYLEGRRETKSAAEPDVTRIFARRADVDRYNTQRLAHVREPLREFRTSFTGKDQAVEQFKKHSPIPEVITLKRGALVMLRQNDVQGRWVNGSLGTVMDVSEHRLAIQLKNGKDVEVEPAEFTLLDADGKPQVVARNFPVTLSYAVTIHKAQGATLDGAAVALDGLWEPGQAYVALSRVRSGAKLRIESWSPRSIFADPEVERFHAALGF